MVADAATRPGAGAARIRVNGIGPGPALPSPRQSAEQFARQCASVPLGRGTSPEEVARAVLAILALPAMTGQMIALDGGQHLQWSPASAAAAAPARMSLAPDAAAGLRVVFVRGLELRALARRPPAREGGAAARGDRRGAGGARRGRARPGSARTICGGRWTTRRWCARRSAIVAEGHTLLVETLAEKIALAALVDPRVARARVSVEKPDAFTEAAGVGVIVERMRD